MNESLPTIVNVPALPAEQDDSGRPRLRGLYITDAETVGRALQVLGVEEDELSDWTIYSGQAGISPGPKNVMFDIPKITQAIEYHAHRNKVTSTDMYRRVVGAFVFTELFNQSPLRDAMYQEVMSSIKHADITTVLPVLISAGVGYGEFGVRGGLIASAMAMGLQSTQLIRSHKWQFTREEKGLLNQIRSENRGLETQLGDITLPVYFGNGNA